MAKYLKTLTFGVVSALIAFAIHRGVPTSCVRLPNGLNIGKQALIDLGEPYFQPDVVPKLDNGTALLPGEAWPFFATATTVYGTAEEENQTDDFRFVWRKDTGLVLKREDPERYARLIKEAGTLLEGTRYGGFSSHMVMLELQKYTAFQGHTCRTRWVNW